ncbi:Uncharacterised protein [Mycobacteroides abscessus subsp. abscessus]|nr:Uncharacterised protein [Mycobacteroides abscessus subsp. abscessus]
MSSAANAWSLIPRNSSAGQVISPISSVMDSRLIRQSAASRMRRRSPVDHLSSQGRRSSSVPPIITEASRRP